MRLLHFSAAKTFAWLAEVVIVGLHRRLLWLAGRLRWRERVVPKNGRALPSAFFDASMSIDHVRLSSD